MARRGKFGAEKRQKELKKKKKREEKAEKKRLKKAGAQAEGEELDQEAGAATNSGDEAGEDDTPIT